VLKGQKIW